VCRHPARTERDVLKGITGHIPIYADATYCSSFGPRATASRLRSIALVRARGGRARTMAALKARWPPGADDTLLQRF